MQDGLDAQTYAAMTAPAEGEGPEGLGYCAGCHGLDGRSGNPHIPRLDILGEDYLSISLDAYDRNFRESGIMTHAASEFSPEQLGEPAAYFAWQPIAPEAQSAAPELAAHAATQSPDVPACAACHGPDRRAAPPGGPGPALAGQYEAYLATQLRLWRDGQRGGGPRAELMQMAAQELVDEEIAALAAYYAGLVPEARS